MSVHIQDLSVCRAVHNQFVVSLHLRKTMNHNEKCLFLQLETALDLEPCLESRTIYLS